MIKLEKFLRIAAFATMLAFVVALALAKFNVI
jgi:hypothetical protein